MGSDQVAGGKRLFEGAGEAKQEALPLEESVSLCPRHYSEHVTYSLLVALSIDRPVKYRLRRGFCCGGYPPECKNTAGDLPNRARQYLRYVCSDVSTILLVVDLFLSTDDTLDGTRKVLQKTFTTRSKSTTTTAPNDRTSRSNSAILQRLQTR